MTIVDPSYRARYVGRGDWVKQQIDEYCYKPKTTTIGVTQPDGSIQYEVKESKRKYFRPDLLFAMAEENGIEGVQDNWSDVLEKKNGEGRVRMSVGNMIRAAARRNKGLTIHSVFKEMPED